MNMDSKKIIDLKERADRAYAPLLSLSEDKTQSHLVQIISRDARNHVSAVLMDLSRSLEKRKLK